MKKYIDLRDEINSLIILERGLEITKDEEKKDEITNRIKQKKMKIKILAKALIVVAIIMLTSCEKYEIEPVDYQMAKVKKHVEV